jgi:hypothetical protein
MSRLARAVEILEAITKHLEGGSPLYPGSQILEDGTDIVVALRECVGPDA